MRKLHPLVFIIAGFSLLVSCATTPPVADAPLPANANELVAALRQGGLNIYVRHGITDKRHLDFDVVDLKNCQQQRNLSDEGREQALLLGKSMRKLDVAISQVIASPYCRCMDTANLAFRDYKVQPELRILDDAANPKERQERITWLLQHLRQEQKPGTNIVYVAHQFNVMAAANILLGETDTAVIRPHGDRGMEVLATLTTAQWQTLARRYGGAGN